jgi:hypothetical protein
MEYKHNDIIVLNSGTTVRLSAGGAYIDAGSEVWAVDECIEGQEVLNIHRVHKPHAGAYCGFVHKTDIAIKLFSKKAERERDL